MKTGYSSRPRRLEERLSMNEAFWTRGPAERPIIGISVGVTFPTSMFPQHIFERGALTPEHLDPRPFLADWDHNYERTEARGEDAFMVAFPFGGVPWLEAMLGCRVFSSPDSESIWAKHRDMSWDEMDDVRFVPQNPWLTKLLECEEIFREHSEDRYPIANPVMRGVSDLVSALLRPERMVLELFDNPGRMKELIARCTEFWQRVGEATMKARGMFEGGATADRRRVWSSGTCILYQDDNAALLSPDLYREFFIPAADEILSCFDRAMIHTHSESLRIMIDGLLSLDSLDGIEVVIDETGKQAADFLHLFKRIQQHKALLITGLLTIDEIMMLIEELSPRGLCLLPKVYTEDEADVLHAEIRSRLDGE